MMRFHKPVLILVTALVVWCAGCSSQQKQQIGQDIQQADTWFKAAEPQIVNLVDLGLVLGGAGALVPINNAGVVALDALRASIAAKQGLSAEAVQKLTTVADLGLTATRNGKLVSANDAVSADLQAVVSAVQAVPKQPVPAIIPVPPAALSPSVPPASIPPGVFPTPAAPVQGS